MATNDPIVGNKIKEYSNWMGDMYSTIPFKLICMPGAHDAGMYKVQHATNLGSYGDGQNVITQSKTFGEMLKAGIRYFDVRPGWYIDKDGTKTFRTGHFHTSNPGTSLSSTMGATGADLDEILNDVLDFVKIAKKEIVFLKMSHYFQYTNLKHHIDNAIEDVGWHNFDDFKSALVQHVTEYFTKSDTNWLLKCDNDKIKAHKDKLTEIQQAEWKIWDCTLEELSDGHSRVVLIFDKINGLDNSKREYSFADMVPDPSSNPLQVFDGSSTKYPLPKADFVLFDCYSNNDNYQMIHDDQIAKYNTVNYHNGDMYLFSWTATEGIYDQLKNGGLSPLSGDSILDLADNINLKLMDVITNLSIDTKNWDLTQTTKVANIIYTDNCGEFVTDAANYVNMQVMSQQPRSTKN